VNLTFAGAPDASRTVPREDFSGGNAIANYIERERIRKTTAVTDSGVIRSDHVLILNGIAPI
jgi:hypothetical protein